MESRSVIYIGSLNYGLFNPKLYMTIVTNTDDYLPMSESEILSQQQYEREKNKSVEEMMGHIDPKDFLQSAYPDPTTGNIHHLAIAKQRGLQLFEMVKSILQSNDIVILYCLFGTHIYPIAMSREMAHIGMHNYVDDLEKGLVQQIQRAPTNQKLTLTLLQAMLPHLTMHTGATYINQSNLWFPQTYLDTPYVRV